MNDSPDVITRMYTDVYGNVQSDQQFFFNGATDQFYLSLNPASLNADIINQKLAEPAWRNNTFELYRAIDTPDFVVTGRGFYRVEDQVEPAGYYWPKRFRWMAHGGEFYLFRAATPASRIASPS